MYESNVDLKNKSNFIVLSHQHSTSQHNYLHNFSITYNSQFSFEIDLFHGKFGKFFVTEDPAEGIDCIDQETKKINEAKHWNLKQMSDTDHDH